MATLYWVGGSTDYDGVTNRFATSSGGAATVAAIGATDNVIFDANSPAAAAVTTTAAISCATVTLAAGFTGSLTLGNTFTTSGAMTHTQGTLNTNGQACSWLVYSSSNSNARTLTMGASAITITGGSGASPRSWDSATSTNMTVTANTATITFTTSNQCYVYWTNPNGASIIANTPSILLLTGSTYANISRTANGVLSIAGNITVTGTFTIAGTSATNRQLISPDSFGGTNTLTIGTLSAAYLDIEGMTGAGTANWNLSAITGGSGDCGGNTGITFTTPATQTWVGTTGGSWNTLAKWTSRIPLPQDDVVISSAFSAGQTITINMPRMGNNIDFTGTTGSPALSLTQTSDVYGNLTLATGMTTTGSNQMLFRGRKNITLTTNGVTINFTTLAFRNTGFTCTLGDNLTCSSTTTLQLQRGGLAMNGRSVSTGIIRSVITNSFTLNMGSGTLTLTGSGNSCDFSSSPGALTLTVSTSTMVINNSSGTATILTGGKTMPPLTISGTSTCALGDSYTTAGAITHNAGTFNTAGFSIVAASFNYGTATTRTLTLGSSVLTLSNSSTAFNGTAVTSLTVTANTARCDISNATGSINLSTKDWNGLSFKFTSGTDGTRTITTTGAIIGTLEASSATGQNTILSLTGNLTVSTCVITGSSAINRPIVQSSAIGTARTITASSSSLTNCDFMDITGAGAALWTITSGVVGDRQGNSGITFTTPATQTRDSTSGQAWSVAARWTSRVPLPQDDVIIDASSGNISATDVLCLGKSINFTGYTGTLTHTTNTSTYTYFGSITLGASMTLGPDVTTFNMNAQGRGSYTITSNGKTWFPTTSNNFHYIVAPGGTYTVADTYTSQNSTLTASSILGTNAGTLDLNSKTINVGSINAATNTYVRAIVCGTATINFNATSSSMNLNATNLSFSGASATYNYTLASTSVRLWTGAGFSFGTVNYTVANSPGGLTISGSNTFAALNIGSGRLLTVTAGTTQTITDATLTGADNDYVYMPGDSYGASTPDSVATSIAGDLDVRIRLALDNWSASGSWRIAGKYNTTGSQKSWRLYNASGILTFSMSSDGAADIAAQSATANLTSLSFVNGSTYWLRFTRVKATGTIKYYYAPDSVAMPSAWTQIGANVTGGSTANIFDSTALNTIGGVQDGTNFASGRYYWYQVRNNVLDDGTGIQLDVKLQDKAFGVDSFTEVSSNAATVTVAGGSLYGDGRLQIVSSTSGTPALLSKPTGGALAGDYYKIQDIHMVQPLAFFTGINCTDNGNNNGIGFGVTPRYKHVQSSALVQTTNNITHSFAATPSAGNLLIAHVVSAGSTGGGIVAPSGWTQANTKGTTVGITTYYKISNGTESTVNYQQTTSRSIVIQLIEYTGFLGVPTLDVTDGTTSGSSVTSLTTAAVAGVSNTKQPALALALWGSVSTLAAAVSVTNSFAIDYTPGNASTVAHAAAEELTSLGNVETTLTWTTARANTASSLVIFVDVYNNWTASLSDTATNTDDIVKATGLQKSDSVSSSDQFSKAIGLFAADSVSSADSISRVIAMLLTDQAIDTDDIDLELMAGSVAWEKSISDLIVLNDNIKLRLNNRRIWYQNEIPSWAERSNSDWYEPDPKNWEQQD